MFDSNQYDSSQYVRSELDYRRSKIRKGLASGRSGRSRAAWARRAAAADRTVR
jgi:hypothetical protein